MFQQLDTLAADPILGLNQQFQQDANPEKINLSIGVYQNDQGHTPVFAAVKQAEQALLAHQDSKSYIAQVGDAAFLKGIRQLILGEELADKVAERSAVVATPGGCGALRMLAELLVQANPGQTVWVSTPTWANHYPLLESTGLQLKPYRYYDPASYGVNFSAMLEDLQAIPVGDVVLLHACCHNPSGADLTAGQWDQVIEVLVERRLLPFFDLAYQGFGSGLHEDAYAIRQAVSKLSEVIIASSCSKNLGMYRERVGAALVIGESAKAAQAAQSHILVAARKSYSMSPYHGSGVVGYLLGDVELKSAWEFELSKVRQRMNRLRVELAQELNSAQSRINFDFVASSKGMFCFLAIPKAVVLELREKYAIYLLDDTRINIAGLSKNNLPIVVDRLATILHQ